MKIEKILNDLLYCLLPAQMSLIERELVDEPYPDDAIVYNFMGSGTSAQVSVGDINKAITQAHQYLSDLKKEKIIRSETLTQLKEDLKDFAADNNCEFKVVGAGGEE